jgi:hypothetical protein
MIYRCWKHYDLGKPYQVGVTGGAGALEYFGGTARIPVSISSSGDDFTARREPL